MVCQLVTRK